MTAFNKFYLYFVLIVAFLPQAAISQNATLDVIDYQIKINAKGIFNNGFAGNTIIKATNQQDSIISLQLEGFRIDSIFLNQQPASFTRTDSSLIIQNESATPTDTSLISIFYQGYAAKDATWGGVYTQNNYAFNLGVGFSSKPHNFGRAWFPCVDNFTDRATYTFEIQTGNEYTAVCSGLLQDSSTQQDGSKLWTWRIETPIPTYLAGFAIGKYTFIKYEYTSINNRNIPVWLAATPDDTSNLKYSFIRLSNAISCFENKFGPYLFERVGFVGVPFNAGAMEHATNIAYPLYAINGNTNYETLMAHELAHHWWGNQATCRTAEDMWLNEGWASYCEAIFLECAYGKQTAIENIKEKKIDVLLNAAKNDLAELPVSGIDHDATYGTHVYKKGALMAHVLRTMMGDDAFFSACKSYLAKHVFTDVSSTDLRDEFQQFTSIDLTQFFDQYIFKKGHYDIVIANQKINGTDITIDAVELKRHKTLNNKNTTVKVFIHFNDGTTQINTMNLIDGIGTLSTSIPMNKTVAYITIDDEADYALAHTSNKQLINNKGVVTLNDVLFSMNVLEVPNAFEFYIEHHWVGPTVGNTQSKGIKISSERYWTVKSNIPSSFKTNAYFRYDGTASSLLDTELLSSSTNEDSLILLYRQNPNSNWTVLTDIIFQPGGSNTDKVGRFWLNNLQAGDYALGIYDRSAVGLNEQIVSTPLLIAPNPANHSIQISLHQTQALNNTTLHVYDVTGKLIIHQLPQNTSSNMQLDVTTLPNGLYHIVIIADDFIGSAKFIKQ